MRVEIWSDVVCPWCYIGKRRFEEALARFNHGGDVEVVWRAFELDPKAPVTREGDYLTRLAIKYGTSRERAGVMVDRMVAAGASEGLDLRFDRWRLGNTFDAHRLLHLAVDGGADQGSQGRLKERLLRATFSEGEAVGDRQTLARLAVEAGLDPDEVAIVLNGDRYAAEVRADESRADESRADEIGISGVPFFLIDGRFAVSGAQSPDVLHDVLERAWTKRSRTTAVVGATPGVAGVDACEGDDCAV